MADRPLTTLERVSSASERETPLFDATWQRARARARAREHHLVSRVWHPRGETRVFHALFRAFLPLSLCHRRTTLHAPWARILNVLYASIKNYWSTRCHCACVLRVRARRWSLCVLASQWFSICSYRSPLRIGSFSYHPLKNDSLIILSIF